MNKRDKAIAREFKRRLSKAVTVLDFKVFGSRARGNADEYSDMDVSVKVECMDRQLKEKVRDIAWETGFEYSIHISPLVFTREEIEDSPLRASPIVESISEEGISL